MDDIIGAIAELITDKGTDIEVARLPFTPRTVTRRLEGLLRGWRVVVVVGATISFIVLTANVSLLIWAEVVWGSTEVDGILTIYDGSCSYSSTAFLWSHLAINIAGSMLLAASNAACQCLTAPTRKDIDRVHALGHYMDVGIPSFRNLYWISRRKRLVWFLLIASSVPLHLIYNSVIFPTTTANEYQAVFVTSDFLQRDDWRNPNPFNNENGDLLDDYDLVGDQGDSHIQSLGDFTESTLNTVISELRANATAIPSTLQRLDNAECIKVYSQVRVSEYRNVLVVAKGVLPNNTIYATIANDPLSIMESYWPCIGTWEHNSVDVNALYYPNTTAFEMAGCNTKTLLESPSTWRIPTNFTYAGSSPSYILPSPDQVRYTEIDHCLAERTHPACTIGLSRSIMIAVIIANAIKFGCFLTVVGWAHDDPLVTVGDAISSFLRQPDKTSVHCGPLSIVDVRNGAWPNKSNSPRIWTSKRYFWFRAASWRRWVVTFFILLAMYACALWFMYDAVSAVTGSAGIWSLGFGSVNIEYVIQLPITSTLTGAVLLANLPQLLISFCYVFFNNILTSCLLAAEYAEYAKHRKPLRVTTGLKSQRSTYWLQLPYRYAVPFLISFTALHWIISQSIFLARIKGYYFTGYRALEKIATYCGYSPVAIVFSVAVSGALIVILFSMGFRRFPAGIPAVGSCSAAIAAACHAGIDEGPDMVEWPLQYGVLKGTGTRRKLFRRRTGFTEGEPQIVSDPAMLKTKMSQTSVRSVTCQSSQPSQDEKSEHLVRSHTLPVLPEIKVSPLPGAPESPDEIRPVRLPPSRIQTDLPVGLSCITPNESLLTPRRASNATPGLSPTRSYTNMSEMDPFNDRADTLPSPSPARSATRLLPSLSGDISLAGAHVGKQALATTYERAGAAVEAVRDYVSTRWRAYMLLAWGTEAVSIWPSNAKWEETGESFDDEDVQRYPRVGFSSLDVEPLVDGTVYR